jgi:tetratricopeptide (TPR) repeat protein
MLASSAVPRGLRSPTQPDKTCHCLPRGGDEGPRLLDDATRTEPERAALHFEAGQAYARRYEEERARAADGKQTAARDYLVPALAHFVQARDLCPLSARTQLRLATHRDGFARAEPREVYISRAVRQLPSDPELHCLAGCLELADGQRARAAASWRRSLALSDNYQQAIVERARGVLTDAELLDRVLPDRARQLVAAAEQLYPEPDGAGRQPFYAKALGLLCAPGAARSAEDYHLKAVLHEALDEPAEAAAAYEAALHHAPRETEWRCALAGLLRREGRLEEARRQVREVLAEHPDHREGLRLLEAIARDRAERE